MDKARKVIHKSFTLFFDFLSIKLFGEINNKFCYRKIDINRNRNQ